MKIVFQITITINTNEISFLNENKTKYFAVPTEVKKNKSLISNVEHFFNNDEIYYFNFITNTEKKYRYLLCINGLNGGGKKQSTSSKPKCTDQTIIWPKPKGKQSKNYESKTRKIWTLNKTKYVKVRDSNNKFIFIKV